MVDNNLGIRGHGDHPSDRPDDAAASATPGNEDQVAAVVSPRSRIEPLFERTATITLRTVDRYYSEPEDTRAAEQELHRLGFTIAVVGPVTISITGPRRLFEEVFGVALQRRKTKILGDHEAEYFEVADDPARLLQPPENLRSLIEGVALARPAELSASPLPPIVPQGPYRYLQVPSEVAGVLRATRVHRIGYTGRGIRVGMIGSGHYLHPYFGFHGYRQDPVLLGPLETDPANDLPYGHGTAVSANMFATAPGARLRMIKGWQDPVGALNLAVASSPPLHVLSNSWVYSNDIPGASLAAVDPYFTALEGAVANAVASGIVVCFSGGNGNYAFPASHPDVIAVGGVHVMYDPTVPTLDLEASSYTSSFGSSFYPGRHVPDLCGVVGRKVGNVVHLLMLPTQPNSLSDLPNTGATNDGWTITGGASSASPQVAGVAALLKGYDPTLTPVEVRQILRDSARDVTVGYSAMGESAGPGPDSATGAGLVDAREALATLIGL